MRVCKEWGSLLLNEDVKVVCEDQRATGWIGSFFSSTNFMVQAQATVVRVFWLGTGAWALWADLDRKKVRVRHYDARMVIPLTWDEDGVSECAFVTRAFYRGKAVDQPRMHLRGDMGFSVGSSSPSTSSLGRSDGLLNMKSDGTYRIVIVCFDHEGNELAPAGVTPVFDTGCAFPTFSIVKPAVTNTCVDMSPYGQSVFADAVDAVQAVDLTFDALVSEIDVSKMRLFLSDVLFDREKNGTRPSPSRSGNPTARCSARSCLPRTQSRSSRPRCAPFRKAKPSASPYRCSGSLRFRAGLFRLRRDARVCAHGYRGVL